MGGPRWRPRRRRPWPSSTAPATSPPSPPTRSSRSCATCGSARCVVDHGVRVDLRGEADPDGAGPVRHLGHDLHGGAGRGGRAPDVPHPEVRSVGRLRHEPASGSPTWPSATSCPTLEVPVTATLIAAGAIATRDFMPVHHDRDYAARPGRPGHLHEHPLGHRLLLPVPHRLGGPGRHGDAAWPSGWGSRSSPGHTMTYTGTVSGLSAGGRRRRRGGRLPGRHRPRGPRLRLGHPDAAPRRVTGDRGGAAPGRPASGTLVP